MLCCTQTSADFVALSNHYLQSVFGILRTVDSWSLKLDLSDITHQTGPLRLYFSGWASQIRPLKYHIPDFRSHTGPLRLDCLDGTWLIGPLMLDLPDIISQIGPLMLDPFERAEMWHEDSGVWIGWRNVAPCLGRVYRSVPVLSHWVTFRWLVCFTRFRGMLDQIQWLWGHGFM